MADPVLAALPEGLQKRQQVGTQVGRGGGLGRCLHCGPDATRAASRVASQIFPRKISPSHLRFP